MTTPRPGHVPSPSLPEYRRIKDVQNALEALENWHLTQGRNPPGWVREHLRLVRSEAMKLRSLVHGKDAS